MNHELENTSCKPEIMTVEVTQEDCIRDAEEEHTPRIFDQLKSTFRHFELYYQDGTSYGFSTSLLDDSDPPALHVSYDSKNKLIRLNYGFCEDNSLMGYFFRDDDLPEEMTAEDLESIRAVTGMLSALINKSTDTVWLCYDKENDSMWINAGFYVTGKRLNIKDLNRILADILYCRYLCLHILEHVNYSKSVSETERNIKALIEFYPGLPVATAI